MQGEACLASFSQSCSELILLKKLSRFYLERATWDQKPGLWAGSSRFPPPWASSSMNRASPAGPPPPGSHPRAGQAWLQTQPLADPVTGKSYHSSKPVSPSGKAGLWDLGSRTAVERKSRSDGNTLRASWPPPHGRVINPARSRLPVTGVGGKGYLVAASAAWWAGVWGRDQAGLGQGELCESSWAQASCPLGPSEVQGTEPPCKRGFFTQPGPLGTP